MSPTIGISRPLKTKKGARAVEMVTEENIIFSPQAGEMLSVLHLATTKTRTQTWAQMIHTHLLWCLNCYRAKMSGRIFRI